MFISSGDAAPGRAPPYLCDSARHLSIKLDDLEGALSEQVCLQEHRPLRDLSIRAHFFGEYCTRVHTKNNSRSASSAQSLKSVTRLSLYPPVSSSRCNSLTPGTNDEGTSMQNSPSASGPSPDTLQNSSHRWIKGFHLFLLSGGKYYPLLQDWPW